MTFQTGISLAPLLEQASGLAQLHVLAVSGQGIVLFLQAVAYVLVSLAALAVLLRFGLRGAAGHKHGGCKCAGKNHSHPHGDGHVHAEGQSHADGHFHTGSHLHAAGSCGHGAASSAHGSCCGRSSATVADSAHGGTDGAPQMHHANGSCADAKTPHGRQVRFDLAQHNHREGGSAAGEPRALARGRLPEQCTLPPVGNASDTDSAATRIRAAAEGAAGNASAASASPASAGECAADAACDADEQRRITAVIAAAVHNVLGGQPHRIVRIEPVSQGWAQEGRRDIFSSHRIR